MAVNNGQIAKGAPINTDDVCAALGLSNHDIAYLCCNEHGKINKASRIKPIRHTEKGELLPAEFKGTAADNLNGIYYGLKVGVPATKYTELHSATLTYYPPRVGTDWSRLTDFRGYDHNARFNPQGSVASWATIGVDIPVSILYSTKNTTGVNISEILKDSVESSTLLDLGDWYPCVLLSNSGKTQHYIRALWSAQTRAARKLRVDGAWEQGWLIPYDMTGDSPAALLNAAGTKVVTVFFAKDITLNGLGADIANRWKVINNGLVFKRPAFACPGATNISVLLKARYEQGVIVTSCAAVGNNFSAVGSWANPVNGRTYGVTVSITLNLQAIETLTGTFTYNASTQNNILNIIKNRPLGIADGTYKYSWTTKYGSTTVASGSGTFTKGL